MKMITISQKPAFRPAHAQPPASSRPNSTRLRGTFAPGPSACWAIVLPSCLLGRERAGHVRMDRAEEGVGARRQRTDLDLVHSRPGEGLAVLEDGVVGVADVEVV